MRTRIKELRDTINHHNDFYYDKDIIEVTVAGISGKVAANGRVTPIIFIDPVTINNELISKVPCTAADIDTGIRVGQKINILRVGTRVAQIVLPITNTPPIPHNCPQCGSLLTRRNSLLFCPENCQNSTNLPAGETYSNVFTTDAEQYSIDPAMYQYIARKHKCRFIPVSSRSTQYNLYFNELNQLADIGFAIGTYIKKL